MKLALQNKFVVVFVRAYFSAFPDQTIVARGVLLACANLFELGELNFHKLINANVSWQSTCCVDLKRHCTHCLECSFFMMSQVNGQ